MCIVSYTNNFLFFHIPKCGGTSISSLISELKSNDKSIKHTHYTYQEAKKIFTEKGMLEWFNNANKFTIVRNPFKRMESLYKYIKKHTDHHLNKRIFNHNFTQFCYFIRNVGDKGIKTQFEHLENEFGKIDETIKIFKIEELNNNLSDLSDIIGKVITEIPITNVSKYYFEKTIESDLIIKDVFSKDLKTFYS